jgi:IstB-like ATP binding protein
LLNHPTLDRLRELGLDGMAKGFQDMMANPESRALDHPEWLGLLVEQEATLRQQRRFEARARNAKLRHAATVEDVDFRTHAVSTGRCSSAWQVATGSASTGIA